LHKNGYHSGSSGPLNSANESCHRLKMQRSAAKIDPDEDDVFKVVEHTRPALQSLINEGVGLHALIWGINMNFAELVVLRGGDKSAVVNVMSVFPQLSRKQRDQAQVCYRRLKTIRENLDQQGFSYDAIMWALIGAIGNISRGIGLSKEEIEKATGDMITRLNMARSSSMN
jgi:hypothetical protein